MCGVDAKCEVRNHVTTCQCPPGFIGDPFTSCTLASNSLSAGSRQSGGGFQDYCNPTPCGANTRCRVENSRAVCSCLDGWMGNPIDVNIKEKNILKVKKMIFKIHSTGLPERVRIGLWMQRRPGLPFVPLPGPLRIVRNVRRLQRSRKCAAFIFFLHCRQSV